MEYQRQSIDQERGGVKFRDYTKVGGPSLAGQIKQKGLKEGLRQVSFIDMLAKSLVFASVGLGLFELFMPRRAQKLAGVKGKHDKLIRGLGARELGSALMLAAQPKPITGAWSRVAGDAMDLGLLGAALTDCRNNRSKLGITTAVIAGITAIDLFTAAKLGQKKSADAKRFSSITREDLNNRTSAGSFHVTRSITINASPETLYTYWRNFENLPIFMYHLESVRVIDQRRSHWVAKAPAGTHVEWDAEITEEQPNRLIAWRSTENADVQNSGRVKFEQAPGGRGTIVRVDIEYRPPVGIVGKVVARLFGEEPTNQVADDLRRFKQVIETGEVMRSDGTARGVGQKSQPPARPMPDKEREKIYDNQPIEQDIIRNVSRSTGR